jgi:3-isopropylmalate/(R)-2-methylmalate dehydratase small subunit
MHSITTVTGTAVHLLLDDIDTDRIIPARYLRCVTFDDLGEHVFKDDRQHDPEHTFNDARHQEASILIAGRNFGCGSSREHAPQALMRWGIQAIVAESYAEIFFGNCTALGIPAVTSSRGDLERIVAAVKADPTTELTVDLVEQRLKCGDVTAPISMPESARHALVSGEWDFLGQLLANDEAIRATASQLPYMRQFA